MTKQINWQEFKCRCSAITMMMSESNGSAPLTAIQCQRLVDLETKPIITAKMQDELNELIKKRENSKKVVLSTTCIGYLMDYYAWVTQKMVSVSREMDIEQLQKGKLMEMDSINLLSVVDGVLYEKNKERVSNDFLSGEPDVFLGEHIMAAEKIIDAKSAWDYPGFLRMIHSPIVPANEKQIQGYCDITGAKEGEVAHCLVNMPESIVNDYRRKLFYKMNPVTDQAPEYLQAVKEMERSMYFNNIPRHQRVFKKKVERFSDFDRQKIYDKVKVCRDWLYIFDESYQKLNLETPIVHL